MGSRAHGYLMLSTVLHFVLLNCGVNAVITTSQGQNVALRKPVIANAQWPACLVDGKLRTTISPYTEKLPFFAVDLQAVYNLTSIHIHAQNEWTFGMQGINVPFSLHVWANQSNACDLGRYYPWQVVKSGLKFKRKGEELVFPGPFEARYIMVYREKENGTRSAQGLVMGELRAFGEKIPGRYEFKLPEDGPDFVNYHKETRKVLLKGQSRIFVEQAWMEYRQVNETDVALAWHHERINTMALIRGKGRVITMAGTKGMQMILEDQEYTAIRENFRTWLSQNRSGAKFAFVDEPYKDGDIVLVNRTAKFSVEDVAKKVMDGQNSLILTYVGSTKEPKDDATELMKRLNIGHLRHTGYYMGRYVPLPGLINADKFIGYEYMLKEHLKNWKTFRTVMISGANAVDRDKPAVQALVRELLTKYRGFAEHYAICNRHQYWKNAKIDMAIANYNALLLMQRGDNIQIAPGVFVSPGDVEPSVKPVSYTVTFNIDVWGNYFPMGGYAKPGAPVRYKVLNKSRSDFRGMAVRINPQMDHCGRVDGTRRWPVLSVAYPLQNEGSIISAFGGPIVLQIPSKTNLTIRFEGVYRYPWFDIRDPKSADRWEIERKQYTGVPYTMISGDNMYSMFETESVIKMDKDNIVWSTTYFDNVIKMMHNLRGSDYNTERMEVFVTDHQISVGWGHSGYPLMGYTPWVEYFTDMNFIKKGSCIGFPHEIGHNLQVGGMTLKWGTEVTNNMYIPIVNKYLLGLKTYDGYYWPGSTTGDRNELAKHWKSRTYTGVTVSYYSYLMRLFTPGIIAKVLPIVRRTGGLNTEERKVNFWVQKLCEQSGYDHVPFHRLWSFPMNSQTVTFCAKYPCFFPDDDITKQVPELKEQLLKEYGKECNITQPKPTPLPDSVFRGINTTRPQSIFIHPE